MSDTLSAAAIATSQEEKIRQRAYEIWEREGRTGNPEDHWFRAQQELDDQGQERSNTTVEMLRRPRRQKQALLPPAKFLPSALPSK